MLRHTVLACVIVALAALPAWTQTSCSPETRLFPEPPTPHGARYDVDVDGNRAVVLDIGQIYAHVYVYDQGAWSHEARLGSGGNVHSRDSMSVALSGDTLLMGFPVGQSPLVWVYVRDQAGWSLQATLFHPVPNSGATKFGSDVALEGDTAIIAAKNATSSGGVGSAGQAYAYVRQGTTWSLQGTFESDSPTMFKGFGNAVALSGDRTFVAESSCCSGVNPWGKILLFERTGQTWQYVTWISDWTVSVAIGQSLDMVGDTLLAGAPRSDRAVVFERDSGGTWSVAARLTASDATTNLDHFGHSVALRGDTANGELGLAAVGAPGHDNESGGQVYVFENAGSGWSERHIFTADTPTQGDWYGSTAAMDQRWLHVGSRSSTVLGQAYIYDCAAPAAVPAATTWMLAVLGALLVGLAVFLHRRA